MAGSVELWLEPGGDFVLKPNGDLLLATDTPDAADATRQRLLRLFFTSPRAVGPDGRAISYPDHIFHPDYGAGLPSLVGQPISLVEGHVKARILRWTRLDPTIVQNPPPTIQVTQTDIATVSVAFGCDLVDGNSVQTTFPLKIAA